jgi:hypothetical protein
MMSDNDFSKKLSGISRDPKPQMADPVLEMDLSHTTTPPTRPKGSMWPMWPMYLCFGMLFVILAFTVLPRGH